MKPIKEEFLKKRAFSRKHAFSLIELIFIIAVIAIITAVAVPKLMDTKSSALISSLKQDIFTITTSIQSYRMLNNELDKITDVVSLNESRWEIENKKVVYNVDKKPCITIEVTTSKLTVAVNDDSSNLCRKISDNGIVNQSFELF